MKQAKLLWIVCVCMLHSLTLNAQKVGLVLSGGGAKGCTHIGVIKALEENNIPIDYVAGTSMGAIVSSFYAMGYTPEEMEDLVTSELFFTWLKGQIDDKNKFYFKSEEETPEFISFKMTIDDSLNIKPFLPTSFVSPDQMNQACLYLFSQATTICKGDFDSLFVPFRCIATDVYEKKAHVHRSGDLSDAVRSSMSFPFVFKPIRVNNHLMFDGGMYNNFPIDIMKDELKADYIIGSSVSDNPDAAKEDDPFALLENLIMQRTNYNLSSEDGYLLEFHYTDVSLLDFEKAKYLIQRGYDSTIAHIDEIKAKINRTTDIDSVNARRYAFRQKKPQLIFKNIIINGVKPHQQRYIEKSFHTGKEYFTFNSFRKTYFKLLSDKKISEIIPHAQYNPTTEAYDLILDVTLNDQFKFSFGGNISSTTSNQLYVGAKYLGIKNLSYDLSLDGQIGILYKNTHFLGRIDFPFQLPFCIKLIGDINHFTYSSEQYAFYETDIPTEAYSTEFYFKTKACIPFFLKGQVELGMGIGKIKNKYHGPYSTDIDTFDKTEYILGVAQLQYKHNSLSHKQYPIYGTMAKINAQGIFGRKKYNLEIDPFNHESYGIKNTYWMQLSALYDHYFSIGKHFSLGLMAECIYSTHELEGNYMETLLMAPSFTPTKHSMMVFNTAFHANTFYAAGLKPIYIINDMFHIRWENYVYVPHKPIKPTAMFHATYDDAFSKTYALSEITAVAQLKYITVGVYVNWYSYPQKNWNAGLNIGYLIFHEKLIE